MKTSFTFLAIVLLFKTSVAQLNNGGFENWTIITASPSYEDVSNWSTQNYFWQSLPSNAPMPVTKTTDKNSGNYAARFVSTPDSLNYIQSFSQINYNINYQPAKMEFYHKFTFNGDTAHAKVELFNSLLNLIGEGDLAITNSINLYSLATININYSSTDVPYRINIYFDYIQKGNVHVGGSVWYIDDVSLIGVNGIKDREDQSEQTIVYPNPTDGIINVKYDENMCSTATATIITTTGSIVFSDIFNSNLGTNSKEINLSGLSKGIYFLQITTSNGFRNKKIIIN